MKIKNLIEGLNAQQRSVPQLPAQARARHISVLGSKTDPKHPFAGYMVGADESAEPGKKSIGPDQNDPYEKGWRARPDAANPYAAGTPEHAEWQNGRDEREAQPDHYKEGVAEDAFQTQQLIQRHADMLGRSAAQLTQGDLDQLTQLGFSIGIGAAAGVAGVIGGYELGDRFISLINKTMRMIKKKAEVDTEEIIKLQRQIVSIHKRLKTLKSEPAIAKYQTMLKQAYEVLEELEARQGNRVAEGKPQKRADRYHINKDGKPASLASYADRDSAVKDRDAKYPDAKVHQVGPRGKVKGEFEEGVAEGVDIGQEWMSDTELDQYVPNQLFQKWRELLGYDRNGKPSALWVNMTGGYEPDVRDPEDRANMVRVANKWFAMKKIPNVKFFDVRDADDELDWLVQIGQQGVAENWDEPLTGWHVVYARNGNKVSGTPDFDSKESAQKYLMTKMSANHHNYRVAHADQLGTSAPTPMGGYLESKGVAETTSDPKFDKMLKGITGKKAVAKQQKTDTKQQTRDAFGSMFGGTSADLLKNLKIREQGAAEERNELDTPAVQAALAKMAERHRGEKWSKEQLAALGKRIAARGQKPVKEDDVADFLARGGKITQVKPNRGPRNPGLSLGSRHIGGGGDGARASRTGRGSKPQGKPVVAVEADVDEGLKSKLAAAALAGAAAFGGGGAQAQTTAPTGVNATGNNAAIVQSLVNPVAQQRFAAQHADTTAKLTDPKYTHNPNAMAQHQAAPQQQHAEMLQNIKNIEQWDNPYRIIQMAMNMAGVTPKEVLQNLPKGYKLPTTEPKTAPVRLPGDPGYVREGVTKEDIITKLKAKLGDYLSDIGQEIRKDPDLINKLAAKPAGNQMGPPVKTITTDDGHQIQIHGNEDDGFRISIKNRQTPSQFSNLDEAVMACEMYCARRRTQALNADYVEEA